MLKIHNATNREMFSVILSDAGKELREECRQLFFVSVEVEFLLGTK
jgi:hypothetical protein